MKDRLIALPALLTKRAVTGLLTKPDKEGALFCLRISLLFGALALAFGYLSNWLDSGIAIRYSLGTIVTFTLLHLVLPGVFEEMIFRVLWLPAKGEPWKNSAVGWFWGALLIFVLWHPFMALTWLPKFQYVFLDWRFLFVVVMLGITCGLMYIRTGSIWPPMILHWATVVLWKTFLGGPLIGME